MTQLTLEQRIRGASVQISQLLETLSQTDYAVSAYQQSNNYIGTLKKQISEEEKKVANLGRIVNSEYADHKRYRDSHMKRFVYKIGGKKEKFQEEATKEEKEWLDAVQQELRAKKGLEQLKLNLTEAENMNAEFANVTALRNQSQVEIDEIYNQVFEGPTPDIPEEDEKEREVKQAENNFNIVQLLLSTEKQAASILLDAGKAMMRAIDDLRDAMSAASADLYGVGGSFSEMAERSALNRAQSHILQVEALVGMAHRIQPQIPERLGGMHVAQQNFVTDVLFDNVFTDYRMRENIRVNLADAQNAQKRLVDHMHAADERVVRVQAELNQAKVVLAEKRQELQQIRTAAFESILAQPSAQRAPADAPPSYDDNPPGYTAVA